MRYCKQRDRYSCGAIAMINIDKHFGQQATYQDLLWYQHLIDCTVPDGTFSRNISKILERASRRTWAQAKQFLRAGKCILVQNRRNHSHYYLMVMNWHGDISAVNFYRHGQTAAKITTRWTAQLLRHAFRTWYVSESVTEETS